jgi:hypothetical protein
MSLLPDSLCLTVNVAVIIQCLSRLFQFDIFRKMSSRILGGTAILG